MINLLVSYCRPGDACVWWCVWSSALLSSPPCPGKNLLMKNLLRWCLNTMMSIVDSLYGFSSVDSSLDSSFESETHTPAVTLISHRPICRQVGFTSFSTIYTAPAPYLLQLYLQNYLYLDNRSFYSIKQCMHGFLRTCSVYVAQQKYKICI